MNVIVAAAIRTNGTADSLGSRFTRTAAPRYAPARQLHWQSGNPDGSVLWTRFLDYLLFRRRIIRGLTGPTLCFSDRRTDERRIVESTFKVCWCWHHARESPTRRGITNQLSYLHLFLMHQVQNPCNCSWWLWTWPLLGLSKSFSVGFPIICRWYFGCMLTAKRNVIR